METNNKFYVSTLTQTGSKGIYEVSLQSATGELSLDSRLVGEGKQTSYILKHPQENTLFAVQESAELVTSSSEMSGGLYVYHIEADGKLSKVQELCSEGKDPCYLEYDATRSVLLSANYSSGSVTAFRYHNGKLEYLAKSIHDYQASTHPRQESAHAHSVVNFNNKYYLSADLGSDTLFLHDADKELEIVSRSKVPSASGPRHLVVDGEYIYLVAELASTLITLAWNGIQFDLVKIQSLFGDKQADSSNENQEKVVESFASHIAMSTDRQFLYVANRGPDSISVFQRQPQEQQQTAPQWQLIQVESCGGSFPRHFSLSPEAAQAYIVIANQNGNNVRVLRRDILFPAPLMNKFKDSEELKTSWRQWWSEFMFRVYFKFEFQDQREEVQKIFVHQLYGVPVHQKSINYRLFRNKAEASVHLNRSLRSVFVQAQKSRYASITEPYFDSANSFEFLSLPEIRDHIHPILH